MLVPSALRALGLTLIVALCLASCGAEQEPGATSSKELRAPHIVLVMADDLGYGDLGWTGGVSKTPTLDQLAGEGLEFTHFHAFPLCSPSRAALLTGRSPLRFGMAWSPLRPWSEKGLPAGEETLAEALQRAGYRTALVGKWHLGHHAREHHPQQQGFDHFFGFLTGAVDYYSKESRDGGVDWQRNGQTVSENGYATRLLTAEATRLIGEHDGEQPLFLMLSYSAPHRPMQAPAEALARRADLSDPAEQMYAAMVEEMDRGIADVVRAIEESSLAGKTLILFLSDNGGALNLGANNGDFRGGKSAVYQGGLRVPAIVHWPGHIESGQFSPFLSVLDLAPSLAGIGGVNFESQVDGRDFSSVWLSGDRELAPSTPATAFVAHNGERGQMALFSGQWKFVRRFARGASDQAREQLFDLSADPLEKKNLIQEQSEIADSLRRELGEWLALDPSGASLDQLPPWDGDAPQNWKAPADWARALR